jgi:hypothetical protein
MSDPHGPVKVHSPLAAHAQRQICCRCLESIDTYATVTMTWPNGVVSRYHACAAHIAHLG